MPHIFKHVSERYRVVDAAGLERGVHVMAVVREIAPHPGEPVVPTQVRSEHWLDTGPRVLPRADGSVVIPVTGEVLDRLQ